MPLISITDLQTTGRFVSADMFGANVVFERTEAGTPSAAYQQAAQTLGVQYIRFGGGQADLDPVRGNAIDGDTAINIVTMPGGALRSEVVNFLNWAQTSTSAGQPISATLIIPTKHLSTADYTAFAPQIATFVQAVMQQYGNVISAFQIGNEYWEMGETAYGQKANLAAVAIEQGMTWAGVPEQAQPDILVQMATAGNNGSEFGPDTPGSYNARTDAANQHIINQLGTGARDAIDGVTEHYYYNQTDIAHPNNGSDLRNIDRDYAIWDANFGQPLGLHITEWNIRTTAHEVQGLLAASTLVHQFENMIAMGADAAHIWTLDYHSRTALTLDTDYGVRLDGQGRLLNSAHGAVFDLMSDSLRGKELMNISFGAAVPGIEFSAYASANEVTLYISSRSWDVSQVTLNVAGALPGAGAVTGTQIRLDTGSTNGRQWDQGSAADSIMVNGQPYHYNEHDADVFLTDLYFNDSSAIDLTLNPFEVVELTIARSLPSAPLPAPAAPAPTAQQPPVIEAVVGTIPLQPNAGTVYGSDGLDILTVALARTTVEVLSNGYGWAEIYGGALTEPVTLQNIERIAFSDGTLALDTMGTAGAAFRLYQASFDRTPDAPGLVFWVTALDSGAVTLHDAATAFLNAPEFLQSYGSASSLNDTAYLDLLYRNVLDRTPDAAGYAFWQAQQNAGVDRADMLLSFADSSENQAAVAPLIHDGIWLGL